MYNPAIPGCGNKLAQVQSVMLKFQKNKKAFSPVYDLISNSCPWRVVDICVGKNDKAEHFAHVIIIEPNQHTKFKIVSMKVSQGI